MFPYLSYFQIAVLGLKHQYIYIYMYIIYHVFFRLRHVLVFQNAAGRRFSGISSSSGKKWEKEITQDFLSSGAVQKRVLRCFSYWCLVGNEGMIHNTYQ